LLSVKLIIRINFILTIDFFDIRSCFPFSGLVLIPSIENSIFHPNYELDKNVPTGYFICIANSETIE